MLPLRPFSRDSIPDPDFYFAAFGLFFEQIWDLTPPKIFVTTGTYLDLISSVS